MLYGRILGSDESGAANSRTEDAIPVAKRDLLWRTGGSA
jgi:hypothetical protein